MNDTHIEREVLACIEQLRPAELRCKDRRDLVTNVVSKHGEAVIPIFVRELAKEFSRRSSDEGVRSTLLFSLGMWGRRAEAPDPQVVELLNKGLTDEESIVRLAAAWASREVGCNESSVQVLRRVISNVAESRRTRVFGIQALERLGPIASAAVPELIEALSDPGSGIRRAGARALGALGSSAVAAIPNLLQAFEKERAGTLRVEMLCAMARVAPTVAQVQTAISSEFESDKTIVTACFGTYLLEMKPDVFDLLPAKLKSEIAAIRSRRRKDSNEKVSHWVGHLEARLEDDDPQIVIQSAKLLVGLSAEYRSRVQALARAYEMSRDVFVGCAVIKELGVALEDAPSGDVNLGIEVLQRAIVDKRWIDREIGMVAAAVADSIGRLGQAKQIDDTAIQLATDLLSSDPPVFVRRAIAYAFSDLLIKRYDLLERVRSAVAIAVTDCLQLEAARESIGVHISGTVITNCCSGLRTLNECPPRAGLILLQLSEMPHDSVVSEQANSTLTYFQVRNSLSTIDNEGEPPECPGDEAYTNQSIKGTRPEMDADPPVDESVNDDTDTAAQLRLSASRISELRSEVRELSSRITLLEQKLTWLISILRETVSWKDPPPLQQKSAQDWISELRLRKRMTLREIADKVGLSESQVSRIARGQSKASRSVTLLLEKIGDES